MEVMKEDKGKEKKEKGLTPFSTYLSVISNAAISICSGSMQDNAMMAQNLLYCTFTTCKYTETNRINTIH